MSSNFNPVRAIIAGLAGTAAMSMMMFVAPMMGLPEMKIWEMLAAQMNASVAVGWAAHIMVGVVLAVAYAAVFSAKLPGAAPARGALFAVAPWLMAQVVMMPMMGAGLFSGSAVLAMMSLMAHLVFGAVIGIVYGQQEA